MATTQQTVYCETFSDHEWGEPRVILMGRHPTSWRYQLTKRTCTKCPRVIVETVWMREPASTRALDQA